MSWQDTANELMKKYGVKEPSSTSGGGSWKDVAAELMDKYSPEKYQERATQVSDWADQYNDFVKRYSGYRNQIGNSYTDDFGGDYYGELSDLMQGYDEIKDFAGRTGLPNAQRYAGYLKDIQNDIGKTRQIMAHGEDVYNSYIQNQAKNAYIQQMKDKYNWDTVQELETALGGVSDEEDKNYLRSLYGQMSTQERYGGKTDQVAYADLSRRYEDASRAYFELRNQLGVYSSGGAMAGSRLESDPELEALRKQVEAAKAEYDALGAQKDELDRREWFSEKSDYYEPVSDAARTATVAKTKEEAKARYDELVKKWGEVEYTRSWDDPERTAIYNEMVAARQAYNAFGNSTYRYINNVDGYRDRLMETDKKQHNAEPFRKYDFMTADEIATYNYLYASEGKKAAEDYLDYLSYYLDKQNMQRQAQEFSEFADKHPVLASISSIPTNLVSGAGLVGTAIQKGASAISGEYKPVNFNTAAMTPSVATQAIRSTVAQKIIDATGTIQIDSEKNPVAAQLLNGKSWADVYQLGMSMADSAAVAGLSAIGIPGGTVLLGGSAGTQGMLDALERGATDGQAITMGILNGTFEALFEYVSLDKLLNGDVQKSALRQILEQAGVEASEEMCTTLANTFAADIPVMGDKSQLTQSMQEYRDAGLSEEEASRKAWADWGTDFLWDGIGGALSGGLMSGGKIAGTKIMDSILGTSYKAQYGGSARELVNDALALDPESKAAQEAQSTLEKGGELSGNQIRSVLQSINTHDKAAIQTAAEQRLKQLGETGDLSRLSAALAKQAAGETLNRSERRAIQFSHYGNQVAAELNPDTKYYENRAPEWRQKIGTSRFNTDEYNRLLPNSAPTQENDSATGKASVQAETTGYTVSEDGKTKRLSTGEEVGIQKIDSVQDGKMTFLLEDGSTVDASDIEYANEGEALIYEAVSGLGVSARAANILVNAFSTSNDVSARDYALGIQEAFQYGLWNAPAQDLNNGPFSSALTAHQRNVAYENGRIVARQRAELAQAAAEKRDGRKKEGKVHFDGDRSGLNQRQKASLSALQTVAKVLGVQIHVFESGVDAEGKHIGENGRYNPEDGSIYIDLYAGVSGQDTMLFTAAHELTHLIRQWSPAKFRVLAGFLMEQYGKHGVSVRSLVEEQISKAKRNKRTIDYDTAYEEVVADSMETMLADGKVVEKLAKLEQRDKSLWQKMKDYISSLAERIRKAYAGLRPDSLEGKLVADMKDAVEKMQELFVEGLVDAGENFAGSEGQKNTPREGGMIYQERAKGMFTPAEIQAIQNIGRKSINSFTTADIEATEEFAQRYWKEMGIKSPFFRAWFGDWRANDQTSISCATKPGSTRGLHHNRDTGWNINISGKVFDENKSHNSIANREARPYIPYLDSIVENAVLLDSSGANPKSVNSLLMHSLYAVADIGNGPEVLKLYVEEMNDPNSESSAKRAYNLQNIEKAFNASKRVQGKTFSPSANAPNAIRSVADLFAAVKRMDVNFNPNSVSGVVNADGTPMVVYHQTGNEFTVFDPKHSGAGSNDQQTPFGIFLKTSDKDIGVKGKKQMALYANIRNPLRALNRSDLTQKLKQLSADYATLCEDYDQMNAEFKGKQEAAGKALEDYMAQWRRENPKASRRDIYEDETFNMLSDAEDEIIDLWEQKDQELSTKAKTAITKALRDAGYDGVFLSDDTGSWGRKTDAIIALDPEQVKSATDNIGTFDRSNPDIRYSDRDPSVARMNQALEKENAKLKEDVTELKKLLALQKSLTHGTMFTKSSVESMAGILMKNADAKGNRGELAGLLNEVYTYIARNQELTWEGVVEKAQPAVAWIQEHAQTRQQVDSYGTEVLRELRGSRISLDENQKKEVAYRFGSFDAYRKQLFGTVTITGKNAVPLDTKWAELAEMYPNVFDAGISSQDQPGALLDAIDSLREMGTVDNWYDQKEAAQDLLYQVYDGYWSVTTLHTVADVKQKQIDRLKGEHHARMDKLKASQKEQLAKLKQEHRDELRQVRQEYRADAEAKQQEVIQKYREAKQDSFLASRDAEIMEAEFLRLVNAYEKQSKQNDRAIADLEKALKKEARSHSSESKTWEQEFDRLMKQYEASDRNVKKLQEKVEAQRKSAKDKVESRNKTAMRSRIQGVVKELNDYLLKGTKDKHIPVELQKPVAAALDAINLDSVGAAMRIGELRQEVTIAEQENQRSQNLIIELAKKIGTLSSGSDESGQLLRKIVQENKAIESRSKSINDLHRKIENLETRDNKMGAHLSQLHDAYAAIANSSDPDVAAGYDEAVEELIAQTIQKVGNTPLRYMDMKQLNAVYDMYKAVLTRVKNANKAFKAARSATVSDLGQKVMQEVTDAGGKRKYSPAFLETIRKFGWDNLKPVYAFERIGSGTFSKIFKNIRAGEDTWVVDINEARSFFLKTAEKHSYHSWNNESRYEFTSTSGMKFSLNLEQIMSLYAYSKREQAADHLRKGGIVIDESTEVTIKTKIGVKVKFNPTEATAYNISGETLAEITGKLTPDQKAFVDEMQEYLSSTMGEKGNEVSLQLYGIKLFKEAYYFPLKSAPQFMKEAAEQQRGDRKIKNAGFSKETVKHASNPVVLTPFMNVWADHVNEMSMYHSFVLPMEDFYRVYNYKTPTTDLAATESVKMCIQNAYGKGATNYIDQLLKDLNGGALVDSTTGIINKSMNLFKKGAVFASASVVIQQPSAIARALSMIDAKYFVGPRLDRKGHKASWEELKRYAPVAAIKEMGYFDTNMGKSARDYILSKEYAGIKEKAKALFTDSEYRDEALSKAPALADEITWCSIWEAVKRETKSGNPGMDSKSEEFLKLAGERFTDVIVKTQVYDSVLSRSANMRSKDTGMKMATAFMAEPTTSINMIADALLKGKRGDMEGRRYCRRAIGSVVAAQILNAILVSFVYAARDDDEEETYWEKYAGSFVGEVLDGLNPAGYIPFVKDVVSIVQGYDVERSDMAVASDLWRACEQLGSDKLSVWRKVEGFAGSICQIFGLPLKNIMRDVRGMYQVIDSFTHSQKTTLAGTEYAIREAVTGKDVSNQEQLYQSYLRGDSEHIERVRNRYEGKDAYNAAMRAAIKRHFISGDIDEATALDYLVRYGGQDENESYWLLDKWKFTQEGESGEDYAKYNKFYAAVQTGKNIRDVIQEYITNGVSETTLAAQITSHFKPEYVKLSQVERSNIKGYLVNALELCGVKRDAAMERIGEWDFEAKYGFAYSDRRQAYIDGLVSAETLRKVLVTKGGYTEKEAEQQIKAYNWMKHNPQYDMDVNTVLAYIQPIEKIGVSAEASGIRPDTFLAYKNLRGNCGGVDSDGDGKADSGSVKSEVMEVINSLPITAKQKDALYYLNGWSESTISEAPWH